MLELYPVRGHLLGINWVGLIGIWVTRGH